MLTYYFLAKISSDAQNSNLITNTKQAQLRDILQNTWLVLFRTVKATEDKDLREELSWRQGEVDQGRDSSVWCVALGWILNQQKDISEMVKLE